MDFFCSFMVVLLRSSGLEEEFSGNFVVEDEDF